MSRTWTGGRAAPPRHRPASSRVPLLIAAACAALLPACRSDEGNRSQILPIRATLTLPTPEPVGPAVFLRQNSSDTDQEDDLVILDVMLRTSGALELDAFTMEISFVPGIIQLGCDPVERCPDPPFSTTLLGTCNQCVRTCVPASGPPRLCEACDVPCVLPDTVESVTQNPLCLVNGADANATGTLIVGVSINPSSDCAPSFMAPGGSDLPLMTIAFLAASTGKSHIRFVTNPDPNAHGDCEILRDRGDLGIPCDIRDAEIEGTR